MPTKNAGDGQQQLPTAKPTPPAESTAAESAAPVEPDTVEDEEPEVEDEVDQEPSGGEVEAESPPDAALAVLDPDFSGVVTSSEITALRVGLMPDLDLGHATERPPSAKFEEGRPDQGIPHAWVSELDGTRFELPCMFRPLHAETWWVEFATNAKGEKLLDGTPPVFKTRNKAKAEARFGDDAWRYRMQLVLMLPKGADIPHVFSFGAGSAATVAPFLQSARVRRWQKELAETHGVETGSLCHPFCQVWQINTALEKSKTNGTDYWQHRFKFEGVNMDQPGVLEAARYAAIGEQQHLDSEFPVESDAAEGFDDLPFG